MSLIPSLPPHIHSTSPPLHDDEMRQVEMYLADQQAIDEAEYGRLQEYLAAHYAPIVPAAAPDAVAALSQSMRVLAVLPEEEEEEIDTHSCADSECQGEHMHAVDDDYYECGHRSPDAHLYDMYGCIATEPYCPATPPYD